MEGSVKPARAVLGEITNKVVNQQKSPIGEKNVQTVCSNQKKTGLIKTKWAKVDKVPVSERLVKLKQEEKEFDEKDIFNVGMYSFDIFNYWLFLEDRFRLREDHLEGCLVTPKMRLLLVDWLLEVAYNFNFTQETYQLSVALTDRYLEKKKVGKSILQLVGIGAIFIAMKYEEVFTIEVCKLEFICDKCYSVKDILAMERDIFKTLDYSIGFPIPLTFLRRFSRAADATQEQHTYAKYITDISQYDYNLCHIKPSKLAAAATFISKCLVNKEIDEGHWNDALVSYTSYELQDLQSVITKLAQTVILIKESTAYTVNSKYSTVNMHKVSVNINLPTNSIILSDLSTSVKK